MPSRLAVAGILAFWIAVTGFVLYRDVWPRVFATGPPPVTIELADEARQNLPARWTLSRNGQKVGGLSTQMKYLDSEDAFQFTYRYTHLELEQSGITLKVPEAVSEVRMTRSGDLKAQTMTGKVEVFAGEHPFASGTIDIRGAVTNGVLTGRADIKSTLANLAGDLDPVPVKAGLPLNPLQPVNRIGHVRAGQEWVVHESNPLQEAVADLFRKKILEIGVPVPEQKAKDALVAQVLAAPQSLTVKGQTVECWVIEYRRAEPVARTWVRVSDGKVMRQEAFEKGESLSFERED